MANVTTVVEEVKPLTAEAVTLRLSLEGAVFSYRPGQYVIVDPYQFEALGPALKEREAQHGKRVGPGTFSLSSDALDPARVEMTIRVRHGAPGVPLLSTFLVQDVRPGLRITLDGPHGRYALPEAPPPGVDGFLHLCAGSGVAPNRGMIRHALFKGWPQRHLLVLQERSAGDVLFRGEWDEMREKHAVLFRLSTVFSGDAGEHVSEDRLRREMEGVLDPARAMALVCGPNQPRGDEPGFCERWAGSRKKGVPGGLVPLGFAPDRILCEMA